MRLLAFGLLFSFCATTLMAQEKLQILDTNGKTTADPVGYFLGFQFGANLAQNGIAAGDVKQEEVIKGMLDALAGKDPAVSDEVIQGAMKAFEQKLQARAAEKAKAVFLPTAKILISLPRFNFLITSKAIFAALPLVTIMAEIF